MRTRIRQVTSRIAASSSTTSTVSPAPSWAWVIISRGAGEVGGLGWLVSGSKMVKVVPRPGSE